MPDLRVRGPRGAQVGDAVAEDAPAVDVVLPADERRGRGRAGDEPRRIPPPGLVFATHASKRPCLIAPMNADHCALVAVK